MPDWWLEATLPTVVFGILLVLWVAIPAPEGESDLASRLRDRFCK
jgi:hypothetical protein